MNDESLPEGGGLVNVLSYGCYGGLQPPVRR
ncbi:Uncharacterised protein [Serratia plymuthica]|nr:Uncharacterised protein [Serratia plymuthica]VEI20888.1 Uncharacterised protein [Serratia plymuthica]